MSISFSRLPPARPGNALRMGSLSPPLSHSPGSAAKIDAGKLGLLFQSQRSHLEYFFDHLDLAQASGFAQALLDARGAIFFSGVGKSGIVAQKLAQTLASLGFARAAFLHPVDALHGDLGAVFSGDIVVFFSKSGASDELIALVPCARAKGARLISVTSAAEGGSNPLAAICDVNVHLPLQRELCPFGLAPLTSASIQMMFGDTIVAALMSARGLTKEQYAANHPAGKIGKSLIFKVKDVMKKKEDLPLCKAGDMIMDQLTELTSKGCGCLLVVDEMCHLIGTFTDGDLRRTLKANGAAIFNLTVGEMCNRSPRTTSPDAMAVVAMQKMESPPSAVQFLPVVDDHNTVIGIVTLHGLVSAGL